jgi:hypothetical protein
MKKKNKIAAVIVLIAVMIFSIFLGWYISYNPAVTYMQEQNLSKALIEKLAVLGNDRELNGSDRALLETIAKLGDYNSSSSVLAAVDAIMSNGHVDWLNESFIIIQWDSDGDCVSDYLETTQYHTNITAIDTDGGGIDDFNEIYTYQTNPNDAKDDLTTISQIPNVQIRHWIFEDGGLGNIYFNFTVISMRDPYIQWLADHTEIKWQTFNDGTTYAHIYVNNIPMTYSNPNFSIGMIPQPSYYFRYQTGGTCGYMQSAAEPILRLLGYKVIELGTYDHDFLEAYKDGVVYVVSNGLVFPRDEYYHINKSDIEAYYNYDPNWYLK